MVAKQETRTRLSTTDFHTKVEMKTWTQTLENETILGWIERLMIELCNELEATCYRIYLENDRPYAPKVGFAPDVNGLNAH